MVRKTAALLGLTLASLTGAMAATGPYDNLFVFGDSYSDTGYGYVDGNGPTAVAYMASAPSLK